MKGKDSKGPNRIPQEFPLAMVFVAGFIFCSPQYVYDCTVQDHPEFLDSFSTDSYILILEVPSSSRSWAFVNDTVSPFVSRKVKLGPSLPTRNFQAGNEGILGVLGILTFL